MAIDELEAQVMRSTLQRIDDDDLPSTIDASRDVLGKLRGIGRKHFAPIIRTPHGPPGKGRIKCFKHNIVNGSNTRYYYLSTFLIIL